MSSLLRRAKRPMDSGPLFDLAEGRRRRDEGMARVDENPSDAAQAWKSAARSWVQRRAQQPGEFNGDDLRAAVGPPPHHPNAMGPIWAWAVKHGVIRLVGYRQRRAAGSRRAGSPRA